MNMEYVLGLKCVKCGAEYGLDIFYTCSKCGIEGILDIVYDYDQIRKNFTKERLKNRPCTLWRYKELLPVNSDSPLPSLAVGCTPVYKSPRLAEFIGVQELLLKDDGRNPTGSFKDRASAIGVVKAKELGFSKIACASTGNAASSLAGFSAAVGLPSIIFVPERAPDPKIAQLIVFGATVVKVKGSYDDAYYFCMDACEKHGWYNRNCAINPYLIEGKKTAGLEIGEEIGKDMPDWVVFSVGDGCTIGGAWKGLKEMAEFGFTGGKLPKMLGIQAAGSAPIADAYFNNSNPVFVEANTKADSIAVGKPRNWRKALSAIKESHGSMVTVEDSEIIDAIFYTAQKVGVFGEPAGATAVAGLRKAVQNGIVKSGESALVVVTGNGLKDVKAVMDAVPALESVLPNMDALDKLLAAPQIINRCKVN